LDVDDLGEAANLVRLIIKKGGNVNAKTKSGETPLLIACRTPTPKYYEIRLLLRAGADPNAQVIIVNPHTHTHSLSLSLFFNTPDSAVLRIVETDRLNRSLIPSFKDNWGWTPLHASFIKFDTLCGLVLLQNGANPHGKRKVESFSRKMWNQMLFTYNSF
jgi:ankyrin repeat protein